MYALKTLSVLAIAATTVFAAPTPVEGANALEAREPQWRGGNRHWNRPAATAVVTVYGYGDDSPAATSAPVAPAQPAQPAAASPPSVGSGGDWFEIANKWRTAVGKSAFTLDSTLVANAQKTADESGGGLNHQLNPGTFAQNLAPGDASNFESVFLGGWLCELPNTPGLNGVCASASQGWNYGGQTGHSDIIQGSYSKIGCGFGSGIVACDFA